MAASAAPQAERAADGQETTDRQEPAPDRDEVLVRYRHLREINKQHHHAIMKFISQDAFLRHARGVGLLAGKTLVSNQVPHLSLIYDLAIYTGPADRTRAVDRYARSAPFAPGSDEALVLDAMCNAVFSIVLLKKRHPVAGLIATDIFRGTDLWLVDEGLEASFETETPFAMRYLAPDRFVMTSGVGIPIGRDLLATALAEAPQLGRKSSHVEVIGDRRFAESLYRLAIASGVLDCLKFQDVTVAGGAA